MSAAGPKRRAKYKWLKIVQRPLWRFYFSAGFIFNVFVPAFCMWDFYFALDWRIIIESFTPSTTKEFFLKQARKCFSFKQRTRSLVFATLQFKKKINFVLLYKTSKRVNMSVIKKKPRMLLIWLWFERFDEMMTHRKISFDQAVFGPASFTKAQLAETSVLSMRL